MGIDPKAEEIIRQGNEYIRNHQDEDLVAILEKEAEIELECKKLHTYFHKDPDVQEIFDEKSNEYQMIHGTRFSPKVKANRFLNAQGKYPTEKW